MMTLYGELGWGSVLVEAQLAWYGFNYELVRVGNVFTSADSRAKAAAVNPLGQIPTLIFDDGTVMTESAAITLRLADLAADTTLVPGTGDPQRAAFLRWLIFCVSAIYPTYTYADEPGRFVPDAGARDGFEQRVRDHAKQLYGVLEENARLPWYLGERFSALDIYVCTMTRWRPRRPWFAEHAPKLTAIAIATDAVPALRPVWARNFDA
jgi:GST-like protein